MFLNKKTPIAKLLTDVEMATQPDTDSNDPLKANQGRYILSSRADLHVKTYKYRINVRKLRGVRDSV